MKSVKKMVEGKGMVPYCSILEQAGVPIWNKKSLVVHISLFSFWWISEFSVIIKLKERP
jgi:hypothetical protein